MTRNMVSVSAQSVSRILPSGASYAEVSEKIGHLKMLESGNMQKMHIAGSAKPVVFYSDEYKKVKGLERENLRDHMTDIEAG